MAKRKENIEINFPNITLATIYLEVLGITPLLMQRYVDRTGYGKYKHSHRKFTPLESFVTSLYWLTEEPTKYDVKTLPEILSEAEFGFPSKGFKQAVLDYVDAEYDDYKKASQFIIDGSWAVIKGEVPHMKKFIKDSPFNPQYLGEFSKWSTLLKITYNAQVIDSNEIVYLFNQAGFKSGVGFNRPRNNGHNGVFKVSLLEEVEPMGEDHGI